MRRQSQLGGSKTATLGSHNRPQSNGEDEKGMWSSMLASVASGKRLPEKTLLILGGTPDVQKEFLETLGSDAPKRPQDRYRRKPVIANQFALGYTYQDVLDVDHEDILARLSIYLMSEPSPSFGPLLKPLFNPQAIRETLLIILLDWNEPWLWARQLRDWIVLLKNVTSSTDNATQEAMEEVMKEWQQRRRGLTTLDVGGSGTGNENKVALPLSQGEWDEPLGLPLSVVCYGADKINNLEVEHNWKEEEFDFILQFLRTILMKHGASLIYTSTSDPNSLPTLIHSSLGIHSLLKKQSLKHNVIDRDKVLVPPGWDSWGKIRVLREGFDVEGVSSGWSTVIEAVESRGVANPEENIDPQASSISGDHGGNIILQTYESTISNPYGFKSTDPLGEDVPIEASVRSNQDFLATQLETINRLQAEDERNASSNTKGTGSSSSYSNKEHEERINEHIGPVQVNMGGIQVDADDMLKKLKNRDKETTKSKILEPENIAGSAATQTPEEMKAQNEALNSFFTGLIKKRGPSGSPRNTPGKEGKAGFSKDTPSRKP